MPIIRLMKTYITKMEELHLSQVLEIERLSFSTPWTRSMFFNELHNPYSFQYLMVMPNLNQVDKVLCYIIFRILQEDVHILNIATHPEFRKNGLALSLMLFTLDFTYNYGCIDHFLEVRKSNIPAINLYRKVGFTTLTIKKRYYSDNGEDAIIMHLFMGGRIKN